MRTDKPIVLFIVILSIAIVAGFGSCHFLIEQDKKRIKVMRETKAKENDILYSAWCKDTGNPKNLTRDEFIMLKVQQDFWVIRRLKNDSK